MGSAYLCRAQLPKVDETNHFFLDSVGAGSATPSPQIFARIRHLEQAHTNSPHEHVHRQQPVTNIPGHIVRVVSLFDAPEVRADCDDVEHERDEGDGEQHEGRPEGGGSAPDGHIVGDFVVFGGVELDEGVDHSAGNKEGKEGAEDALDEAEGADAAFDLL